MVLISDDKSRLFDEKYKLYGDMLFKLCIVYLKNYDDTEDAVQDAFIKLLYYAPAFKSEQDEKYWLLRVAINICKNKLKSHWHSKTDYLDYDPEVFQFFDDNDIRDLVLRLPVKYKAPVHLYYFEEYSVKEISKILNISVSAVKIRLKRGRDKLKTELEEMRDE